MTAKKAKPETNGTKIVVEPYPERTGRGWVHLQLYFPRKQAVMLRDRLTELFNRMPGDCP